MKVLRQSMVTDRNKNYIADTESITARRLLVLFMDEACVLNEIWEKTGKVYSTLSRVFGGLSFSEADLLVELVLSLVEAFEVFLAECPHIDLVFKD